MLLYVIIPFVFAVQAIVSRRFESYFFSEFDLRQLIQQKLTKKALISMYSCRGKYLIHCNNRLSDNIGCNSYKMVMSTDNIITLIIRQFT